jgi:DNA-binding NarL/FixJ family response regulator
MNRNPSRPLNVLVMHSDPLLCAGVVVALRQQASLEVYVHGVDDLTSNRPPIDVVIAEYQDAVSLTDRAVPPGHGKFGDARILALTANGREADVRRAVEAGVHGYLLLGGPLSELLEAVTTLGSGVRYLSRAVAQRMADSLTRAPLTSRETEVLRLVAMGQSNKAIARRLAIEEATVKTHVSGIMSKLGAVSRTQAASMAVSRGLVDDDEPARTSAPLWQSPMAEKQWQFAQA